VESIVLSNFLKLQGNG